MSIIFYFFRVRLVHLFKMAQSQTCPLCVQVRFSLTRREGRDCGHRMEKRTHYNTYTAKKKHYNSYNASFVAVYTTIAALSLFRIDGTHVFYCCYDPPMWYCNSPPMRFIDSPIMMVLSLVFISLYS